MTRNIGTIDRTIRIVIGFGLIAAALGLYGPAYTSPWGWIGVLPLLTALIGWCPPYAMLGISTCERREA